VCAVVWCCASSLFLDDHMKKATYPNIDLLRAFIARIIEIGDGFTFHYSRSR
jgi:hypothetical protein